MLFLFLIWKKIFKCMQDLPKLHRNYSSGAIIMCEALQATVVRDTFVLDAKVEINSFQVFVALPSHDRGRQQWEELYWKNKLHLVLLVPFCSS